MQDYKLPASMFPELSPSAQGPTPEQMERERERALYQKSVTQTGYFVEIYDLHDKEQVKAYQERVKKLYQLAAKGTCVVIANERQILTRDGQQSWYKYLEWSEYELQVEATPRVGDVVTRNKEDTDV